MVMNNGVTWIDLVKYPSLVEWSCLMPKQDLIHYFLGYCRKFRFQQKDMVCNLVTWINLFQVSVQLGWMILLKDMNRTWSNYYILGNGESSSFKVKQLMELWIHLCQASLIDLSNILNKITHCTSIIKDKCKDQLISMVMQNGDILWLDQAFIPDIINQLGKLSCYCVHCY